MSDGMLYTVSDLLTRRGRAIPAGKVAVVDGDRCFSYGELAEYAARYGSRLREAGVSRGDRVGILLRRSAEAVISFFATYWAGGVPIFIHESLRPRQVNYILRHSEAAALITDTRQLLHVPEPAIDSTRIVNVDEEMSLQAMDRPVRTIGTDLALIMYTSGSTGLPKGVMASHENLLWGARIVADYLQLSGDDVLISLLPFSFDYGLNQLLTTLLVGGTLVIQRSVFPVDVCKTLEKRKITGMAAVPTLWLQLLERGSPFTKSHFPNLRYITNSGGRLPEAAVRLIRRLHPHVEVYLMYGLTEAFRSTYLPPDQVDMRPTSIGKAIPNAEMFVVNEEGRLCHEGEVGELVHRGSTVTMGYWKDPESTAKVFRHNPLNVSGNGVQETVVFSGDLVRTDREGFLYFVGRRDQLIKSRGFRVSPEEVEEWILSSDLVGGAVAFGVSGNNGEDQIVVAISPKDPGEFHEELVHEFCKREMPPYMMPRVIWVMDEFPLTTSRKPDRSKIKEMYVAGQHGSGTMAGTARTA